LLQVLHQETKGEAIITTGVGQHQMFAAQWYPLPEPRRWVTSGGLGSMGFGLPSALGAAAAHDGKNGRPSRVVVDIDGDGSFLMNCQELATAAIEKLNIKVLLLNNQHLGMVVQWEDRFYKVRQQLGVDSKRCRPFQQTDRCWKKGSTRWIAEWWVSRSQSLFTFCLQGLCQAGGLAANKSGLLKRPGMLRCTCVGILACVPGVE
jgi:hypothetical protein